MFCLFHFIFSDKAYIFSLKFWLWAIWKELCVCCRGEGSPCRYTLCFMAELLPKQSWTQCATNYFPLNWFFQLVLYISYRVLYYFPHRAFLLMIPKQADKNSIFFTEIFRLLRLSRTIITSWKMQWSFFPEYFYIKLGTRNLALGILRL